ncbi:uncharacterized protein LOC143017810 [Oratosquilla oratoria]|uniref:uncharacterized protein LOC143017810 n=1 Tax=Oratosquilla oratoria TaxID=337810 RepID=UPI003F758C32
MKLAWVTLVLLVSSTAGGKAKSRRKRPADGPNYGPVGDLKDLRESYRQIGKTGCPTPPETPPGIELPTVPESFSTSIEIDMIVNNTQMSFYSEESYDGVRKRGAIFYDLLNGILFSRPFVLAEEIRYDIDKDEALFILTNDICDETGDQECHSSKECLATDIDGLNTELQQIFGIVHTGSGTGFMGATGMLMFGPQFGYTQQADMDCRGLVCKVYSTCIESQDKNTTINYTYYWSDPDTSVQNDGKQVPIALDIIASGAVEGHTTGEVIIRYNFFRFFRDFRPSIYELEPPKDVFCDGRKSSDKAPAIPVAFNFRSEIVESFQVPTNFSNVTEPVWVRVVFPQDEYYDWHTRISRFDYLPLLSLSGKRRIENRTSLVHDFNQGLSYHIKDGLNWCRVTPIEDFSLWGDVHVASDGSINMLPPWAFADMDEPLQYNGLHWDRGMETDVWVGVKFNPTLMQNETYVWHYASIMTNERPTRDIVIPDKVPVKLEKFLTAYEEEVATSYNIYDYEYLVPHVHKHDISLCYDRHQMRHYTFDLPANALNASYGLRDSLAYFTVGTLAEAGNVSPLRINRLELEERDNSIGVTFTLLDKPNVEGDAMNSGMESDLNEAGKSIKDTIDNSQLVILVHTSADTTKPFLASLVALPGTLKEVERDDGNVGGKENPIGFGSGDMAGLAVGMIFLGAIVGFAAIYLYTNKK